MGTSDTLIQYVIVDSLGAFLCRTIFIWQQCAVRQYHSDLSDQSALEIRVKIGVRLLELHYFSIFTENNENEHLIFREFYGK